MGAPIKLKKKVQPLILEGRNKENDQDNNVEGDEVECPVDCVCRDEVVLQALNENRKSPLNSTCIIGVDR